MLGDVALLGCFSCGIDDKGRIILPSIFESEKGDRVAICQSSEYPSAFDLYPLNILANKINKLDELILTSQDESIVSRALNTRKELCALTIEQLKVDANRRIFIGNILLESFKITPNRVYGLGECDKIKFFTSPDDYQEYTGRPYVKKVGDKYGQK